MSANKNLSVVAHNSYVGRLGALAVAFGIGSAALALPAVAYADTTGSAGAAGSADGHGSRPSRGSDSAGRSGDRIGSGGDSSAVTPSPRPASSVRGSRSATVAQEATANDAPLVERSGSGAGYVAPETEPGTPDNGPS